MPSPLAGHAVNPSMEPQWRHPCRHMVPQAARTPRLTVYRRLWGMPGEEQLSKRLRSHRAGAAGARNRHVPTYIPVPPRRPHPPDDCLRLFVSRSKSPVIGGLWRRLCETLGGAQAGGGNSRAVPQYRACHANTQHAQQPLQNESQLPNPQSPPLKHPAPAPCAPVPGNPGGAAV